MKPFAHRPARALATLALALTLCSSALAQTYTVTANGSATGNSSSGANPVEVFWDEVAGGWITQSFARAEGGALKTMALVHTYALYNIGACGTAEFDYDDVVFTSTGTAPIQVGLKLTIDGNAAVALGNSFKVVVRHGIQLVGEATMNSSGAVNATSGLSGWDMKSAFSLVRPMTVPVNTPVKLKLFLSACAGGSAGGHKADGHYELRLGGANPIPAPCEQYTVFDLPPGVTVNSVQAGITDNTWWTPHFGDNYCVAAPNSVSPTGAVISASGSSDIAANDLVLSAGPIPVGQMGIFIHGATPLQLPFGEGFLCTGGGIIRVLPPGLADASGFVTAALDNTGPAGTGIAAGASRNFQLWYRDPLGGDINGDGSADGFSLSDAKQICFH